MEIITDTECNFPRFLLTNEQAKSYLNKLQYKLMY